MRLSKLFLSFLFLLFATRVSARDGKEVKNVSELQVTLFQFQEFSFYTLIGTESFLYQEDYEKPEGDFFRWSGGVHLKLPRKQNLDFSFQFRDKQLFNYEFENQCRLLQNYQKIFLLKRFQIKGKIQEEEHFNMEFSLRNRFSVETEFAAGTDISRKPLFYLFGKTEALWRIRPNRNNVLDQRNSLGAKRLFSNHFQLSLYFQHRALDYTHKSGRLLMFWSEFTASF